MFVCLIIIAVFVFKFPEHEWLFALLCFAYVGLKSWVKKGTASRNNDIYYDEFDWWQDNQGLFK